MRTTAKLPAFGILLILLTSGCLGLTDGEPTTVYPAEAYSVPQDDLARHGYETVVSSPMQLSPADVGGSDAGSFALRGHLEHYERADPRSGTTSTLTVLSLPDVEGTGVVDPFIYSPIQAFLHPAVVEALPTPLPLGSGGEVAVVPVAVDALAMPLTGVVSDAGDAPSHQNGTTRADRASDKAATSDAHTPQVPVEFESFVVLPLNRLADLTLGAPGSSNTTFSGSDFGHVVVDGLNATYLVGDNEHVIVEEDPSNSTSTEDGNEGHAVSLTIDSREVDIGSMHGAVQIVHVARVANLDDQVYLLAVHAPQQPEDYFRSLDLASAVGVASSDPRMEGDAK